MRLLFVNISKFQYGKLDDVDSVTGTKFWLEQKGKSNTWLMQYKYPDSLSLMDTQRHAVPKWYLIILQWSLHFKTTHSARKTCGLKLKMVLK